MISLVVSSACFLAFLLFELFFQSLDRVSPIKLRGLVEEYPGRLSFFAGKGEVAVVKTTLKVLVQALALAGLWLLVQGLDSLGVPEPWAWGGGAFLLGWLVVEGLLMRLAAAVSPDTLLPRLGPAVAAFSWLLAPLALPIRIIFRTRTPEEEGPASDEEIQAYIDVGREEGILEKEDEKLLMSIVDFGETMVKEVMTPRTDIAAVEEMAPIERVADAFLETKYSRLPVYRRTIDTVIGIVHIKDLFRILRSEEAGPLASILRPIEFVPETKRTAELLQEFQRRHLAMAIVVDEYGSVSGLVTMEDLLEEIVGEIADEHEDEREAVVALPGGAYSISARHHIDVLRDLFGHGPEEEEFDTLGGFLASRLGRIPKVGETCREDGLLFTVEEADRRRVLRVRVEPAGRPEKAAAAHD
jgi:putative hemolysin